MKYTEMEWGWRDLPLEAKRRTRCSGERFLRFRRASNWRFLSLFLFSVLSRPFFLLLGSFRDEIFEWKTSPSTSILHCVYWFLSFFLLLAFQLLSENPLPHCMNVYSHFIKEIWRFASPYLPFVTIWLLRNHYFFQIFPLSPKRCPCQHEPSLFHASSKNVACHFLFYFIFIFFFFHFLYYQIIFIYILILILIFLTLN